jgi:kumamolisin
LNVNSLADTNNDANKGVYIQNNSDGSQTLLAHVPADIQNSTLLYPATQIIETRIILPITNQPQLTTLLQGLYDPTNANYHNFLTADQFINEFPTSTVDRQAIVSYLNNYGIQVPSRIGNGIIIAKGPASAYESAFGITINYYQRNDGLVFFAPATNPTLPPSLTGKILAIAGLDNIPKYHQYINAFTNNLLQPIGSGPNGFWAPKDVMTANNLNILPTTGYGQTIGLFEMQSYSTSDIQAFEAQFGLPDVPLTNYIVDGLDPGPDYTKGANQVTFDIEMSAAMAPDSSIAVYGSHNTTLGWIDEWTVLSANFDGYNSRVVICNWGISTPDSPTVNFDNMVFQEMAAQGQTVFVAAGNMGAYGSGSTNLTVDEPASQPYVTAAGISKLNIDSNGNYTSESASLYGGGGISNLWTMPAYQQTAASGAAAAAKVSTTMRNIPDVAMPADPATPYAFYINGNWGGWWGSSIASTIWGAFFTSVNQGLGANAPVGFLNPMLYQIEQTANYTNDFHSITTGNNGYYPAEPGFNDATGLGSLNGLNLYNNLVPNNQGAQTSPPPSVILQVSGTQASQVSLAWSTSPGATSYNIKKSTVYNGSYTTIASATSTAYIDNSVTTGTTYYYVVSAVNSYGEGVNSNQVRATTVNGTSSARQPHSNRRYDRKRALRGDFNMELRSGVNRL